MTRATRLALVGLFVLSEAAAGQMAPGARSVAMGGGGMIFATGVDAAELNPANLAFGGGWNVALSEFGVAGLGAGATVNEIMTIFGAESLGDATLNVAQVIDRLPDNGLQVRFVTDAFFTAYAAENIPDTPVPWHSAALPSIGFSVGPFALRARSRNFTDLSVSKELADLIGNGFAEENVQDYAVGNTGWRSSSLSELTAAYGFQLGLLSIGVGGRYVIGNGMSQGLFFEPEIDGNCVAPNPPPGCDILSIQTVAVEAEDGSGFGLDVGLSLDLPGGFRAAASGTNVLQRMNWNDALLSHSAAFTESDFDEAQDFVELLDRFETAPLDPDGVSLLVFRTAEGLLRESFYPQVFRGGVGWSSGGTTLEANGIVVAPRGRFTSPWDERLTLGIEQVVPVATFRAGYAIAQDGISAFTGGLGLRGGPIHLEFSGGRFGGNSEAFGSPYDGYYGTIALQLKGGGL